MKYDERRVKLIEQTKEDLNVKIDRAKRKAELIDQLVKWMRAGRVIQTKAKINDSGWITWNTSMRIDPDDLDYRAKPAECWVNIYERDGEELVGTFAFQSHNDAKAASRNATNIVKTVKMVEVV